jgi:hypothetical protein
MKPSETVEILVVDDELHIRELHEVWNEFPQTDEDIPDLTKGASESLEVTRGQGYVSEEECRKSAPLCGDLYDNVDLQALPRFHLAVLVPVHDPERRHLHGRLQSVTEQEIGVAGIEANVGEIRTLVIPAKPLLDREHIWFEAQCLCADEESWDRLPSRSFRITAISKEHLANLRELVRLLSLAH